MQNETGGGSTKTAGDSSGEITETEKAFILKARAYLENPGLLIRIANAAGKPIDYGMHLLPAGVQEKIQSAVKASLEKGLTVVSRTLPVVRNPAVNDFALSNLQSRKKGFFHSAATFGTGAIGGFFGIATLPLELPVTTAIMLRSIVSTAQDFGFDISDAEVQLECLYVLSLGSSNAERGEAVESAYWTSRLAFTDLIRNASREIEKSSAPILLKFLSRVAARFELVVSEKAMAELVPVLGAVGGGVINTAFTHHFNEAARFHFGLRALEVKHGVDAVKAIYSQPSEL